MKSILLAASLLLSSITFAGPSCIWDLESTEVKNINGNQLTLERYDCRNKDWWKGEVIADVFKASNITRNVEAMDRHNCSRLRTQFKPYFHWI